VSGDGCGATIRLPDCTASIGDETVDPAAGCASAAADRAGFPTSGKMQPLGKAAMTSATTQASRPWINWGLARRGGRRKAKLRRECLRRLERLEDRTMLNASIDIDAAALLTYNTDPAAVESLQVAVTGNVYTFFSNTNIDIASNVPGLTIINPGTPLVTVTGITGLTVDMGFASDELRVISSNVPTAINMNASDGYARLGDPSTLSGLGAITSPVTVIGPGVGTPGMLDLEDVGSSASVGYDIAATTITANNGFGGLTYSGVQSLRLGGATSGSGNTFTVVSTADGVATTISHASIQGTGAFLVESTSAAAGSLLNLVGAPTSLVQNTYQIRGASTDVTIVGGLGPNDVTIGGGLVGVANVGGAVTLESITSGEPFQIHVDDSPGVSGDDWNLAMQASPSILAELTGFSATGSLIYDPTEANSLTLSLAAGQPNVTTVDFRNGNPLPAGGASPALDVEGGSSSTTPSDLVLKGTMPAGAVDSETHTVSGSGAGVICLGAAGAVSYSGLSPHSIYDTLPATNYVFNDLSDPDGRLLVSAGVNSALTDNFQTLLIASSASTPTFTDTYIANKTNVAVNVGNGSNGVEATVDYELLNPVQGLTTLTVASGAGADSGNFVALPPGVTSNLQQNGDEDHAYLTLAGTEFDPATNLDGGLGYDILVIDASGLAITPGNFAPGPGGSTVISGAPLPAGPITYSNYEQLYVHNLAAVQPVVTAATVYAVQGQRLVDATAGTFTSAMTGAKAADFLATIDWGDGSKSAGMIVQDASNPSVFYVMGTHTYYEDSTGLTTHVTVASLGNTTESIINGVPVQFYTPASDPVTADGTAVVDNASISLTAASFTGFENITPSPADVFTATFTDAGGVNPADADPAANYSVLINWGDGGAPLPVPSSAIVRNGTSNSYTVTVPQHVYSTPGTYIVTVTVSDGGPNAAVTTATGIATIADAPLTEPFLPPLITFATEGVLVSNTRLAAFVDANPLSSGSQFTVTIDWGDGSPQSYGSLVQPGGVGTAYFVVGSHTYADALRAGAPPVAWGPGPIAGPLTAAGSYPLRIFVQDTYGSAINLSSAITVNDQSVTVSGGLNPSSDSGASNSDGVTNVAQPNFQGSTSEGGALVYVYATPTGGAPVLIGRTTADANGAWSVTSGTALADGAYAIQAQAYDASGHTVSALTTVTANLVIDTVGPKVADLVFDNLGGQVVATFQDTGGANNAGVGLNFATVVDANNYRFALIRSAVKGYRPPIRWIVGGIAVVPGNNDGAQVATIKINDGRGVRGGRYLFTARSVDPSNLTGIQDLAGNALDGEFYSFFPSGNNHVGGDFVAELDAVHHRVYAPKTNVGTASPVYPPGRPGTDRFISRPGRTLPTAAAAVRLAAARANAAAVRASHRIR